VQPRHYSRLTAPSYSVVGECRSSKMYVGKKLKFLHFKNTKIYLFIYLFICFSEP